MTESRAKTTDVKVNDELNVTCVTLKKKGDDTTFKKSKKRKAKELRIKRALHPCRRCALFVHTAVFGQAGWAAGVAANMTRPPMRR